MTPCTEFELLLTQQIDGALTDKEAEKLRDHLSVCDHCRRLEQELLQIHQDLALLNSEPPAHLAGNIMAAIRAESSPAAPIILSPSNRTKLRRWVSTAAVFFLIITATAIGSRILPMYHSVETAPGTMDKAYQKEATSETGAGSLDESTQISALQVAEDNEASPSSRSNDPAEESTKYTTSSSGGTTSNRVAGSDGSTSADNNVHTITGKEADVSVSIVSPPEGGMDDFAPESSLRSDVYTAGAPKAETALPGNKGLTENEPLDAEGAEALLIDYFSLPPSDPMTITYEGLTPEGDAHLFLVTRPEHTEETYSVALADGTVKLLPSSDSESTLAP
ncbi:MAG: hypothetical protein H6Q61_196 [Firmicutes bacterium]|nr:hypothetical protein [Bacillota bacterium]